MRLHLLLLPLLVGCGARETTRDIGKNCGKAFCYSPSAKLIGTQQVEDFNTYQLEWDGNRIGIYEGDFPTLSHSPVETIDIAVDRQAELRIGDGLGIVSVKLGDEWPRFLEITGPCSSSDDCVVAEFAKSLTRTR
jgi:hypothetical protein